MGKVLFFAIFAFVHLEINAQEGSINPDVYNKPLPEIINVEGQPDNFKFTSHIVNIKVPQNQINNWNTEIERQYIQTVFDLIPDKHFVINNYSGFYFPESSGLPPGQHMVKYKNTVQNIGLDVFNYNHISNSSKFLSIIRLRAESHLRPNIITHEIFHQWNSYLESANYWLMDPSYHTGLVDQNTSVFESYRQDFELMENSNRYRYKQYISNGFVSELEGYLAGLWDMPDNLRTLKNYYHGDDTTFTYDESCECSIVENVQAEGIVDLNQSELFDMYGGERIPSYQNAVNIYESVVIVFSAIDFLIDNDLKIFHYASILEETRGSASHYNAIYDEIFILAGGSNHPDYGRRQLNPYHASYMNLHFHTNIFDPNLSTNENFMSNIKDVVIYPVPSNKYLVIDKRTSSSREAFSYKISNVLGQTLTESESVFGDEIDVSHLQNGHYFIKITMTDSNIVTKKFIKK